MCDICVNTFDVYFINFYLVYYLRLVNLNFVDCAERNGRQERPFIHALEAMANMMAQANEAL